MAAALLHGPPTYSCGLRLVSVDGPAGTGKTTAAAGIADRARAAGRSTAQVAMDDLYDGWDGAFTGLAILRDRILTRLSTGRDGAYARYDWSTGGYAETHRVTAAADVLVVEGVLSADGSLAGLLGVTVLLLAPAEICLERMLARDGQQARARLEAWQAWERPYFDARRTSPADFVFETG